jgi:hypothetical protein
VEEEGLPIPEEWKPKAKRVYDNHIAQLGAYFILIEAATGTRPTHGYVVIKGGERHRIENTAVLRVWVLEIAEQIRAEKLALRAAGLLRGRRGLTWPKSSMLFSRRGNAGVWDVGGVRTGNRNTHVMSERVEQLLERFREIK